MEALDYLDYTETFDEDYLWFYETVLDDERNRRETTEIISALGLEADASVLDAPCGHGRISNLLAAEGFDVTGVDITPLFLERAEADARTGGVEVTYLVGDLRRLPVAGPFDAAVCWFTSFGYFDDDGNRAVLAEFARVLRPGGTLLIETMHHDGFVRSFTPAPASWVTERGDDVLIDSSTFDPVQGRVDTQRTIRRAGRTRCLRYSVRLPTVPELDRWLADAGFVARRYQERDGQALRYDSWRLLATATR